MVVSAEADLTVMSTLLLLSDGRFPSGGHAHSGGFEAAASLENIVNVPGVESYVLGRLYTVGFVAASFAAAACVAVIDQPGPHHGISPEALEVLAELDDELDARTPSPALRGASRQLGRQVIRAGRAVWPDAGVDALATTSGRGLHHPVALGAVAAAGGLGPQAVALAVAHDSIIGPASAAVRLLGLDPFAIHAALARLTPHTGEVAARAASRAYDEPANLPSASAPLADIAAELHATWEVRLFAS